MIDVETELFNAIVTEIQTDYAWGPNVKFINDYVSSTQKFPAVTIVERDNRTVPESQHTALEENYAVLDYEVQIYTNSKAKRKKEARTIAAAIDKAFISRGFRRRILEQIPNAEDWSVFRMVARYTAIVDPDHMIYRRP